MNKMKLHIYQLEALCSKSLYKLAFIDAAMWPLPKWYWDDIIMQQKGENDGKNRIIYVSLAR